MVPCSVCVLPGRLGGRCQRPSSAATPYLRRTAGFISSVPVISSRPARIGLDAEAVALLQRRDGVPVEVVVADVELLQLRQPRRPGQLVAAVVGDEVVAEVQLL